MKKLAVLVTGSPRFVKEGAEWWNNCAKPKNFDVDLYGHCWNEHDTIGAKRYYKKKGKTITPNYFKNWNFKDLLITKHSLDIDLYTKARSEDTHLSRYLLWKDRRDHIISVHYATDLMIKSKIIYDAVLVMRFDCIIKPKSLDKVIPFVLNFYNNATEFDKGYDKALFWNHSNPNIFTPWVQIRQGLPVMQDYMFLSSYNDWLKYTNKNLYQLYYNLLNVDTKFLDKTNFVKTTYHPHVFWALLGLYSNANFISNPDLGCVVLRKPKVNVKNVSYKRLVKEHNKSFDDLCTMYLDTGKIQNDL